MSVRDYGSSARRALGRTVDRTRLRLGLGPADDPLDPERAIRSLPDEPHLLFLCYGNICRSPMAARYARQRLADRDVTATVESAGFHDEEDRESPDTALAAAAARDVDLADHRSQAVTASMVAAADLVVLKDVRNYRLLRREFPDATGKAAFLRVFGDGSRWAFEIGDPYAGDRAAFDRAYRQVVAGVDGLLDALAAEQAEQPDDAA